MSYLERIYTQTGPLKGQVYRVAETQEKSATTDIVDTAEEQSRLEELLEESKPPYTHPDRGLHYLLKTPFRYPPLRYGSRFGRVFEKSLFYGSADTQTALSETAYYRLVFVRDTTKPFPRPVKSHHTIFEASVGVEKGLQLQSSAWRDVRDQLTHPSDYAFTQALGGEMREAGVQAFQFISARAVQVGLRAPDAEDRAAGKSKSGLNSVGLNWGVFTPKAFRRRQPSNFRPMIAVTTREHVSIVVTERDGTSTAAEFPADRFMVAGQLPRPAV